MSEPHHNCAQSSRLRRFYRHQIHERQMGLARAPRLARIALAAGLTILLPNVFVEPVALAKKTEPAVALTPETIDNAKWSARSAAGKLSPVIFKAQVWLDRAGFSPGEIDAHGGENFDKALRAYQQANGLETGRLNEQTWNALANSSTEPTVRNYTIAASDVEGPFIKQIPKQFSDMAKLGRLAYQSPRELLAEKFHMSEQLLSALNKGKTFDREGIEIVVANVAEMEATGSAHSAKRLRNAAADIPTKTATEASRKAERVEVHKSERSVRVVGRDGKLIAFYPASIGSTEKPAPSGKFVVRSVNLNPSYHYNPKYAFKGQKATEPVTHLARTTRGGPGLDRPIGRELRTSRHTAAAEREQNRIAWLHSAYQLGCARPRQAGPQGHSCRVY
jgi:peptidoglycan hydrolase-like protein with peptidoglycan-binding domain